MFEQSMNLIFEAIEFEILGWTKFEHNVNMALLTALDLNKVCPPNLAMKKADQRLNILWIKFEFYSNFEQCLNRVWIWFLKQFNPLPIEQSLNKVWIWNYRMNKVWTQCEYGTFDCLGLEQTVNKVCPPNLTMKKAEQRLNILWMKFEF